MMLLNFIDFASNYKVARKRLTCQLDNIIPRAFPVILDPLWSCIKRDESLYLVAIVPSGPLWSRIKRTES